MAATASPSPPLDTNNGASSGTQTAAITINNSTTVIETVPEALSGNENSAISLATITVSDSPNTTDILTMALTVSHGTITVGTPAGIVSDNGSASVTLTGTAAAINAALATTSYTANLNYFGSDSLAVTTTRHQQRRQLGHPDRRHHHQQFDHGDRDRAGGAQRQREFRHLARHHHRVG